MIEKKEYRILEPWEVYGLPKPRYLLDESVDEPASESSVVVERPDITRAAKKFDMVNLTSTERYGRIWDMTVVTEKVKGGINRIFYPEHPLFDSPFSRFARYVWGTEARNNGDDFVETMLMKAEAKRACLKI